MEKHERAEWRTNLIGLVHHHHRVVVVAVAAHQTALATVAATRTSIVGRTRLALRFLEEWSRSRA